MKKRKQNKPAGAEDSKLVPYQEARDRFLARIETEESDRLESYVSAGKFTFDRWLAEELTRQDGQPLDEHACWDVWDQCSEKHFRDIRTDAVKLLNQHMRKARYIALMKEWAEKAEPMKWVIGSVSWIIREALSGFMGAIGLLIFGLLLVWLSPHITKSIRGVINDNLPADTRPANTTSTQ